MDPLLSTTPERAVKLHRRQRNRLGRRLPSIIDKTRLRQLQDSFVFAESPEIVTAPT